MVSPEDQEFPPLQEPDTRYGLHDRGRRSRSPMPRISVPSAGEQRDPFPDYLELAGNALSEISTHCADAVEEVRDKLDNVVVFPAQSPHVAVFLVACAILNQLGDVKEHLISMQTTLHDLARNSNGSGGVSRDDLRKQTQNMEQIVSALMEMSRSLSTIVEEQSGETLSPEVFRESLEKNFDALSRKVENSLRNGRLIIPGLMLAACLGGGIGIGFLVTKILF